METTKCTDMSTESSMKSIGIIEKQFKEFAKEMGEKLLIPGDLIIPTTIMKLIIKNKEDLFYCEQQIESVKYANKKLEKAEDTIKNNQNYYEFKIYQSVDELEENKKLILDQLANAKLIQHWNDQTIKERTMKAQMKLSAILKIIKHHEELLQLLKNGDEEAIDISTQIIPADKININEFHLLQLINKIAAIKIQDAQTFQLQNKINCTKQNLGKTLNMLYALPALYQFEENVLKVLKTIETFNGENIDTDELEQEIHQYLQEANELFNKNTAYKNIVSKIENITSDLNKAATQLKEKIELIQQKKLINELIEQANNLCDTPEELHNLIKSLEEGKLDIEDLCELYGPLIDDMVKFWNALNENIK